jgi:hypothetical protein
MLKIQQLIGDLALSSGTKRGKLQYQATNDAAVNALKHHIPCLKSAIFAKFQNQVKHFFLVYIQGSILNSHSHFTTTKQIKSKSESNLLCLNIQKHLLLAG